MVAGLAECYQVTGIVPTPERPWENMMDREKLTIPGLATSACIKVPGEGDSSRFAPLEFPEMLGAVCGFDTPYRELFEKPYENVGMPEGTWPLGKGLEVGHPRLACGGIRIFIWRNLPEKESEIRERYIFRKDAWHGRSRHVIASYNGIWATITI
jgi:hypothetical protein